MGAEAATGFLSRRWGWSLSGFRYSGMVVPKILRSMSEKLYGENVAATEEQAAGGGGAEIDHCPKCALHRFAPSLVCSDSAARKNGASWIGKKEEGWRTDVCFRGRSGTATLWVWIRFGLDVRWDLGLVQRLRRW